MTGKPVCNKPFYLVDRKAGPRNTVSETDVCQFVSVLEANLRLNEKWREVMRENWHPKSTEDRGFIGADKATKAVNVDGMLAYVAGYAPPPLYRAIEQRCRSLDEVWKLIRRWAGIQTSGLKLLTYSRLVNSWDPSGDLTPNEFYYILRDCMEDTLLIKNGKVKHNNVNQDEDEEMTPALESVIVKDWLIAIGGQNLFEHCCRVYAKDLETETIATVQERIAQNLETLMIDVEANENVVKISKSFSDMQTFRPNQRNQRPRPRNQETRRKTFNRTKFQKNAPEKTCTYCKKIGRTQFMHTHTVGECWELSKADRADISRVQTARHPNKDYEEETEEEPENYESDEPDTSHED